MKTKVLPLAYRHIQEFLIKVCIPFFVYSICSMKLNTLFLIFSGYFIFRLEPAVLVQTPSLRFTRELIYSLQMCPRTYACQTFWPHLRMFLTGTNDLPHTLRFCLPLQMSTSMTIVSLSSHTPLILTSLNQFTTGHTLRNSTLPKTGLA